ncbi:MAG: hypothetical protein HS126_24360 [Anaerolineales bacterium]|nr:hypothetical protein [Anaerolineales bacterium]
MSKQWKIVIGVVIALVVLSVVGAAGVIAGRRSTLRLLARRPAVNRQLEVRLIDDNKDGVPDRGVVELPNQGPVNRPRQEAINPSFGPGRPRPFGLFLTPFLFISGLVRGLIALAFLALLVSLTIFFYRRWQPIRLAAAPVTVSPTPVEVQSPPASVKTEDRAAHEG